MTLIDLIKSVRSALTPRNKWIQGSYRNKHGQACLIGACLNAIEADNVIREVDWLKLKSEFQSTLLSAVKEIRPTVDYGCVENFNDSLSTSHDDILKVLDISLSKLQPDRKLEIAQSAAAGLSTSAASMKGAQ